MIPSPEARELLEPRLREIFPSATGEQIEAALLAAEGFASVMIEFFAHSPSSQVSRQRDKQGPLGGAA